MPGASLLEPAFLRKLETLTLNTRKIYGGQMRGERRTHKRGSSVEFADYREYSAGDDLRYVDWKAYGRLGKLFVKLFREEEDLSVHILLDNSKSMNFGAPVTKAQYAIRVAAALGYIGLREFDRVTVSAFSDVSCQKLPALRGRSSVVQYFRYLEQLPMPSGKTSFSNALRRYAERESSPGIAIVCSDFLDDGVKDGLNALLARRYEVVMIQILDPQEVEPVLAGDLRLLDSETNEELSVSISPFMLNEYRARLDDLVAQLNGMAQRHAMEYVRLTTQTDFEDALLGYLRTGGLVR